MTAPLEVELKLELPPSALPQFRKLPLIRALQASAKRSSQVSVYFDSDGQKLRRHGLVLRVRRIGDRHIQTIKATRNSNILTRDEWESEITDGQPDLGARHGARSPADRQILSQAQTAIRNARAPDSVSARARRRGHRTCARRGHDRHRCRIDAALRDRARAATWRQGRSFRHRAVACARAAGPARANEQVGTRLPPSGRRARRADEVRHCSARA